MHNSDDLPLGPIGRSFSQQNGRSVTPASEAPIARHPAPADGLPDAEPALAPEESSLAQTSSNGGGNGDAPSAHGPAPDDPNLRALIDYNFLSYASYVIRDRAIPALEDGLKPVQRRIMHSLYENDDGKFIKVANIVGYTMQYHPHGDASIADALVNLAQKRYLIEGQGNFGNLYTGDPAAASRYIECRLTELARNELFNEQLTRFVPSYDGRNKEPVVLPCKLPLLLMLGADGIAVGLSTRILPHNFCELIEAQIAILQGKSFSVLPDFQTGGLMDASDYDKGFGKVKLRAVIEPKPHTPGTLVIRQLPAGTTTDSLIASIEDAARKKKLKIRSIDDFTAEDVEIEIKLSSGEDARKTINALYHFTECEQSISVRPVVIRGDRPVELSVDDILRANTTQLLTTLKAELELKRESLLASIHAKTLAQIFIEERIYKSIEKCTTYEAVQNKVLKGVNEFRHLLRRDVNHEDVEKLLALPIKRISQFDIDQNKRDIDGLVLDLGETEGHLKQLTRYATSYLKNLLKLYGKQYARRTRLTAFEETDAREHAVRNLPMTYDKVRGYLGYEVKGDGLEPEFLCSELDRILVVSGNGSYKVIPPPEKLFVDRDVVHCALFNRETTYTVVFTLGGGTYVKRFAFGGTILNKEYNCVPAKARISLLTAEPLEKVYIKYKPFKPGAKLNSRAARLARTQPDEHTIDLRKLPVQTPKTFGQQLSHKGVDWLKTTRPRGWAEGEGSEPVGPLFS
ncbi:MAG: DNA topoisomerase IV subunit A [Verrucomicrobia bacterium]|nr:DNA topoisomerase IV subunit A [Verrucomicrobiota bacterium]